MNRLAVGILATLFLLSSLLGAIQDPATAPPRGSLAGLVLDSVTGQPIEGVQVALVLGQALTEEGVRSLLADQKPTLKAPQVTKVIPALVMSGRTLMAERAAHSVLTDSLGKFTLTGLEAGTYSLAVRADGYNFQVYGGKPDSLVDLRLDIRENRVDVGVIRMNPEPRISGAIMDLAGNPVSTVPVYLLRAQPSISVDGQRQFRVDGETLTDAAGRYVFEKIAAGRYHIVAGSFGRPELISYSGTGREGVRQPRLLPYRFTYYPGVPDVGLAGQIDVPAGMKVTLGDMVMPTAELSAIRGRVVDYATGKPPESVRVTLSGWFPFLKAGTDSTQTLSVGKYDRTSGVFEFTDLIPGQYRISAVLPRPQNSAPQLSVVTVGNVPAQSAFQIVELRTGHVNDLVLTVPGIGRVAGRVVVTDGKPLPVDDRSLPIPLQLMLRPFGPLQPAPTVTSISTQDGSFEVGSSLEGKYRFYIVPLRDNYYISETRLDGVNLSNGILNFSKNATSELIITLSPGGQLQGSVVDKAGQPVKRAQGLVLPDPIPETISFYQTLLTDGSGQFTVNNVPPGNHKIYVWLDVEVSQFFDRDLLARSRASATPVRVERGATATVSVPIIVK